VVAGPVLEDLRQVMWDRVGLVRTGDGLWQARSHILEMESVLRRTIAGRVAFELSLMVILAALRRSESRGGHYRADYPELDPMQEHRTLIDPTRAEMALVS
jgi:L-aspartate oxidase